uniref:Uncharacterized protein n=1 Tax=Lotharella oceanica TaxID=641309 RepID=A0A7S2XBN8_9EUKA|mmetsp:Transcript_26534/g.49589  ORF Transcript_26534/g.49589 Transcript_26534/m.49589 type:complete len:208 (+) Transcript_26534:148-771(+)
MDAKGRPQQPLLGNGESKVVPFERHAGEIGRLGGVPDSPTVELQAKDYLETWLTADAPVETLDENKRWARGLFDVVTSDPHLCLYGCLCPALLFADTSNLLEPGMWWEGAMAHGAMDTLSLLWCLCLWPVVAPLPCSIPVRIRQRWAMRKALSLKGSVIEDVAVHFFCYPCALSQEYKEASDHFVREVPGLELHAEIPRAEADVDMD